MSADNSSKLDTTILYKELNWLTKELSSIDYSSNKQEAILYELGLVRSMLAQLMYNDSANVAIVKKILKKNPYKR